MWIQTRSSQEPVTVYVFTSHSHLGVLQPELLQRAGQRQPLPVSGVARVASETFVKTAPEVEVVTAETFSFVLNTQLNN